MQNPPLLLQVFPLTRLGQRPGWLCITLPSIFFCITPAPLFPSPHNSSTFSLHHTSSPFLCITLPPLFRCITLSPFSFASHFLFSPLHPISSLFLGFLKFDMETGMQPLGHLSFPTFVERKCLTKLQHCMTKHEIIRLVLSPAAAFKQARK